jgi:phosphoenolpyruvate carboxykinase (ATP)
MSTEVQKKYGLESQGINGVKKVYWNLTPAQLYEKAVQNGEAIIAADGALVVHTGKYTGRSPNDKFIVREPSSEKHIWWGKVNKEISADKFDNLYNKILDHVKGKELYVFDGYAGTDPDFRIPIRVINEFAWQNLFVQNMFVRIESKEELANHKPEYTVVGMPNAAADPAKDGTNSEAYIIPHFGKKMIIIGGTHYGGEMKKSIFTLLNYLLPLKNTMSMHCSANMGHGGDTAIYFGLSGTGKTTLSADPERLLIGDDEHGWSENGVFNIEGGCYAKVIRLSEKAEPEIYATTRRFGTLLENVVIDKDTRKIDLDSDALTENTRASYPLHFIPNMVPNGRGGHPKNVIMLTCDAFGVLPPVARLTPAQAMYHFLSGYTAKVAGTERGVTEPTATFSPCFGGPFMAQHPGVYAKLLGEKIAKHKSACWLVNTGWSGGQHGVGKRISIPDSRAIIKAILSGELDKGQFEKSALFGFEVPKSVPGVSSQDILNPRNTWQDKDAYDKKAQHLAGLFQKNFKDYEAGVSDEIRNAGPQL